MKNRKVLDRRKKFILELLADPVYKPMRLRELAMLLELDKKEKSALFEVLEELCIEGKVVQDSKGRYKKVSDRKKNFSKKPKEKEPQGIKKEGVFIGHPKGFGFVEVEGEEDIFIPEEHTGTAVHQDQVRVVIKEEKKEGKRSEGIVTEILKRGMPEVVGTYQSNREYGFVISDNPKFSKDIFIGSTTSSISVLPVWA